jgi:hypothetical protein
VETRAAGTGWCGPAARAMRAGGAGPGPAWWRSGLAGAEMPGSVLLVLGHTPVLGLLRAELLAEGWVLAGVLYDRSPAIGWVIPHLHPLTDLEPAGLVHSGEDLHLESRRNSRLDADLELDDQLSLAGQGRADGEDLARRGAAALAELLS